MNRDEYINKWNRDRDEDYDDDGDRRPPAKTALKKGRKVLCKLEVMKSDRSYRTSAGRDLVEPRSIVMIGHYGSHSYLSFAGEVEDIDVLGPEEEVLLAPGNLATEEEIKERVFARQNRQVMYLQVLCRVTGQCLGEPKRLDFVQKSEVGTAWYFVNGDVLLGVNGNHAQLVENKVGASAPDADLFEPPAATVPGVLV